MSDTEFSQALPSLDQNTLEPASQPTAFRSFVSKTFSNLAFENHGARLGLEINMLVFLFLLLSALFPSQLLGMTQEAGRVASWFISCGAILIFDQHFLCKPVFALRKAQRLLLNGEFTSSLEFLEKIAPSGTALVQLPRSLYLVKKLEILTQGADPTIVEHELEVSREVLPPELYKSARMNFLRETKQLELAKSSISETWETSKRNAIHCVEFSLVFMEEGRPSMKQAKSIAEEILKLPNQTHPWGESTYFIGNALIGIAKLYTGDAENGLLDTEKKLNEIVQNIFMPETMRFIASKLALHRALYHASHGEPELARQDLELGIKLCRFASCRRLEAKVREELAWRYPLTMVEQRPVS